MPATLTIFTDPIGSQRTSAIASDEPADKNDFVAYINSNENVSGLTQSDLSVSSGSIVSLEGENAAYRAVIRPPETAAVITLTIAANAVTEGNPETTKDIRVSTSFPDDDAEDPTQLASFSSSSGIGRNVFGIAVTPTRILVCHQDDEFLITNNLYISKWTHAGVEQTSERVSRTHSANSARIDYINGDILLITNNIAHRSGRYRLDTFDEIQEIEVNTNAITHSRLGMIVSPARVLPYGSTQTSDLISHTLPSEAGSPSTLAHQDNLLYYMDLGANLFFGLLEITDSDAIEFLQRLNINTEDSGSRDFTDIAIYRDTLYFTTQSAAGGIYTLDIRPYRPMAKNTKSVIYPVFANEGDTIPLTQFCPDAKEIIWDTGFDLPSYLSINADNEIEIANNAVTETTPVLLKLRGINYIDSVPFEFYLVIVQAAAPTVRDVGELTMRANHSYDMFQLMPDADSIALQSGPAGSSLSNGVFTIGTTGGDATFRATKGSLTADLTIEILVVQAGNPDNFSDIFRHRVEIAGIDVTPDVVGFPTISGSLDDQQLNMYTADNVTLTLRSDDSNDYKYNNDIADNFWETNNLNIAGFREPIKVFYESLVNESWVSSLMFSGKIDKVDADFDDTSVLIECEDLLTELQDTLVQAFGTLSKWDALRQQSDEESYQGEYVPEPSLLPMQALLGEAWTDRQKLTLRALALPSRGIPPEHEAYLTPQQLLTAGGFLPDRPLLQFNAQHKAEEVRFLVDQIGLNKTIYNAEVDVPAQVLDDPFVLNRGSAPYSVERTRNTRLPVDWVHDPTNERVLNLLGNPEGHIADLLVQYDIETDAYRTLHTFNKDIKVHRIERRNATNYYLLTSAPISQDRSAATLPRASDATGYAYDSIAEGSEIKIYHYNASTDTLTEHVPEDDDRPPQLGIHTHAGFENDLYVDTFEGITADYRGAFKWYGGNLYYRYATDSEFGVARVNTSGTTSEMVDQPRGEYWDHLNFAFDITSTGTIYFVYATGTQTHQALSSNAERLRVWKARSSQTPKTWKIWRI